MTKTLNEDIESQNLFLKTNTESLTRKVKKTT